MKHVAITGMLTLAPIVVLVLAANFCPDSVGVALTATSVIICWRKLNSTLNHES